LTQPEYWQATVSFLINLIWLNISRKMSIKFTQFNDSLTDAFFKDSSMLKSVKFHLNLIICTESTVVITL